ncbi:MAG: bifunctional folylpolyglutamate synthase/dihydrofolate synthase [Rhodospirillaceae bacterium]|nr:bifunctional folylpolyglutamate synthase/dihydrofolate synthase [Rhodospirillaceae bacterium]
MATTETISASVDRVLQRLTRLHPKVIDLSLGRVQRLLERVGHPERALPPVVHVAGTNGKGSVIAYLRAMLEAAGYAVHVYTSPHLVRFNERIRLGGRLIPEEALLGLLEECERANGEAPITFFEITTVAAFLAFARRPADILLLETGLGGRLDATNVIDRPLLTVLTPISFDHMQHLGNTLAEIAGEKAGILKPGVPAVVAPQPPEAGAVFDARAAALRAPLHRAGAEWAAWRDGDALAFRDAEGERRLPLPALPGPHQIDNAGTALACLRFLSGFAIDRQTAVRGLRGVEWPARLQRLSRGPLVKRLRPGWELWLDGGHNAAAGEALAATLREWQAAQPWLPVHLVFGMLSTKEPVAFLRPLAPLVRGLHALTIPGEHASLSAAQSAAAAREAGLDAREATSVAAALDAILAAERGPARVLICGSLYLAGTVLAENG